ncbi:DUF2179 domain-containing protein [Paenibacillus cellulositrophicus]|uniref:UPF0316 protein BK138_27900 n=2 Tax=Paenibacillus TaxID=44249 RepID=A0A1R1EF50_9BACL|nr:MULTISPECIES: DUF2179 domain-containing protein [Paenibacillus]MBJ9992164.1 DUF2179 domain-containing protein [Paenibacillus sp. S28]OMF50427.1 hypothetical protein BK138_27900 [Paenibacillus rhizosphaerae]OXL85183.1 hypothetical protein BCV73_20365 [Paenibacillus sp. SSG-1]PQP85772.1 DUF2179 domain-containing protein [Paenibacillus sp. AR247]RED31742.1 uncharacterized protein YebE (UPF0316 family) [Paenibacillus sp. VMFN-D1]
MLGILIFIFVIQIVYVSFFTLRMILTLKGQKYLAAVLSMFEITIYVLGLSIVLKYVNQPLSLIVYAVGYGLGVLVGSWIENRIALGYITMKVIVNDPGSDMANTLRNIGYGVTSWIGSGRDGHRLVFEVLAKRKNQKKLYNSILELDPKAFIVVTEPVMLHGGFWTRGTKK